MCIRDRPPSSPQTVVTASFEIAGDISDMSAEERDARIQTLVRRFADHLKVRREFVTVRFESGSIRVIVEVRVPSSLEQSGGPAVTGESVVDALSEPFETEADLSDFLGDEFQVVQIDTRPTAETRTGPAPPGYDGSDEDSGGAMVVVIIVMVMLWSMVAGLLAHAWRIKQRRGLPALKRDPTEFVEQTTGNGADADDTVGELKSIEMGEVKSIEIVKTSRPQAPSTAAQSSAGGSAAGGGAKPRAASVAASKRKSSSSVSMGARPKIDVSSAGSSEPTTCASEAGSASLLDPHANAERSDAPEAIASMSDDDDDEYDGNEDGQQPGGV